MKRVLFGTWALALIFMASCNDGPDAPDEYEILLQQIETLDTELGARGVPILEDPSGIRMIVTKLGRKLPAQLSDKINVDYVGRRYTDKVQFDNGNANSTLSSYIDGWQIALSKLPAGSEATIFIPSAYGYKSTGSGTAIPPNTILEFDVKFNSATPPAAELQKFAADTVAIKNYLTGKGISTTKDSTGMRYVITQPGSGSTPSWYNRLTLDYTIKLLSDDTREIITIEQVPSEEFYSRPVDYIHGLKIGLQKLSIGSKAVFYIPSGYAFGPSGASDPSTGATIPANANIIIELELIDIE